MQNSEIEARLYVIGKCSIRALGILRGFLQNDCFRKASQRDYYALAHFRDTG
jgi:hypothetical protein